MLTGCVALLSVQRLYGYANRLSVALLTGYQGPYPAEHQASVPGGGLRGQGAAEDQLCALQRHEDQGAERPGGGPGGEQQVQV